MSALALVTDAYGGRGGIAQFNRDFLAALSRGAAVVALPRFAASPAAQTPAGVRQLAPSAGRLPYTWRAARLTRARPDLIFCGHLHMAPLAAALARAVRAPLWLHAHGIEAFTPPSRLVRAAVARARLVTCASRHTRARLLRWTELPPSRVRVLPPAVRPAFTPGAARPDTLAREGLEGAEVILTIARLSRADAYKGHERVIAAMPAIRARRPRAIYAIVGEGDRRAELEALVAASGLREAVRFLGYVEDDELPNLCRAAALFAMPSFGEGFGIAFAEAAACGLPVIGGDRDGGRDALADGALGRLIDPMSVEALAGAAIAALGAPRPVTDAARRFATTNFDDHVLGLLHDLRR